ncbi:MAG TPA: outer membrane beta-barrel protein [Dongiaceae bacterium]|jgi:opacity protein-like surface antigen|nr:outer membrane beta-barrel protein [Dongiaceae bacterium]
MIKPVAALSGAFVLCQVLGDGAPAAWADGFYVNLHAGPRYLLDADLSRNPHDGPLDVGRLHFDNVGGTVGVAGGYDWDNGLALETEFAYRRNGLDHDVFHGDSTDLDGSLSSYTLLGNVYYRLDTGTDFTPYIGGGVGISLLDLDMKRGDEGRFHALDTDTQFAYQGIAGMAYALAPHWSLGVEYRFFGTQDPSFIDHPDGNRVWTETVYHAHELLFGVTYRFQ